MNVLKSVRDRETDIELEIGPILAKYKMLELFLPPGRISSEEKDEKEMMRIQWRKLVKQCEQITFDLSLMQHDFKRTLLTDVKEFKALCAECVHGTLQPPTLLGC